MDTSTNDLPNPDSNEPQKPTIIDHVADPKKNPRTPKNTLTGFPMVWTIFWIVANLGATCAPANNLTNPRLGGMVALVMLLSAVVAAGYILLYTKKPVGLFLILIGNLVGMLLNFLNVTVFSITITTGLIVGIITYFITRKQVPYPFGKTA